MYIYCGAKKETASREFCFLFTWLTCMKLGHVICWGLAVFFCLFFVFLSPFIPFIFYRDLTAKVSHKQRVYICILTRMLTTANAPPPPSLSNSSPLLPHYFFYLRSSKQLGNSKERPTTIRNNNNNQRVVHLFCMYCQLIDYQLFYTIYCTHISFL